ncbi:MAG TPA: glycosyltransferase [Candidatus Limnocylindria bacterium]|jgi:glycosyltransferase involved in cell wall biosynthesis|nr:glycosyltransferase [Candidatus Limnocylindria bacterium]
MKLALAHEYFAARGGAERVVDVLHAMWPEAPVYTFFHDRRRYGDLAGWDLRTSYLQRLPIGGGLHRVMLPLFPGAARRLSVADDTDLALVSTSAFIKGLRVAERTALVAYCHSPTRYLWDWREEYLREEVPAPLRGAVGELLARLRETDRAFASRVDRWIANSTVVKDRIRRYYERESEVVHPPVDVDAFAPQRERGDYWVYVGRLSAYKRADVAVRAFKSLGMRLVVVGEGRERSELESIARDNIAFAGHLDDATLRQLLGAARGLIFPAEDDFGIVCVEALASGAPVVALAAGGASEIVRDGIDGALVTTPEPDAFAEAVLRVEQRTWDVEELRRSARRFDVSRFRDRIRAIVEDAHARGRTTRGIA